MIKEKVKALWRLCFDDSQQFMDMYFELRYNNEVNIAIESGNEVIAALQTLPYPMTLCEKVIETSYISGACTHPEYRSKGVMRELLAQAHTRMLQRGVLISTLIPGEPWLFDYYTRMGYASVFGYSKKRLTLPKEILNDIVLCSGMEQNQEQVYNYLNAQMAARPNCVQHTETDFQVVLADLQLAQGKLYVATSTEGELVGIAMGNNKEGVMELTELLTDSKEIEMALLRYIKKEEKCKSITIIAPPTKGATFHPLGMARIIDAKAVLQLYAATAVQEEINIELTDDQLSVNNGYYYLCNGRCMYSNERLPGAHLQLTIAELSQRILAPLRPYMSLMLN